MARESFRRRLPRRAPTNDLEDHRSDGSVSQKSVKRKGRRERGVGDAEVDRHRPALCRGCGAACRPPGGPIQIQGHGTRPRGQQGPRRARGAPESWSVTVFRYICILCGKTTQVAPQGVIARRRYGATAIASALCLFGLEKWTHHAVREAIGVGGAPREAAEQKRWGALVHWSRAARAGQLLDGFSHLAGALRDAAARAATAILGHGPRVDDRLERVWAGAIAAPWRGTS